MSELAQKGGKARKQHMRDTFDDHDLADELSITEELSAEVFSLDDQEDIYIEEADDGTLHVGNEHEATIRALEQKLRMVTAERDAAQSKLTSIRTIVSSS